MNYAQYFSKLCWDSLPKDHGVLSEKEIPEWHMAIRFSLTVSPSKSSFVQQLYLMYFLWILLQS